MRVFLQINRSAKKKCGAPLLGLAKSIQLLKFYFNRKDIIILMTVLVLPYFAWAFLEFLSLKGGTKCPLDRSRKVFTLL